MRNVTWLLFAIAVGICGFFARSWVFRRFGVDGLGLLAGEVVGWTGYFLALAIAVVRAEGGWHAPGLSGALYFTLGSVFLVGSVTYLKALARLRSKARKRR